MVIAGEKQREGVPLLRHFAHPVGCSNKCASAEYFQHVADIDHERLFSCGVFDGRCIDPHAFFIENFKAGLVGEQQGEALIVGVCTNSGNIFDAGVERVMDQPQLSRRAGHHRFEIPFRQAEREGESVEQTVAEGEDCVVVGQHPRAEIRQIGPLIGADQRRAGEHQRMVIRCLEADIESLFMVRLAGAVDLFSFRNVALMAFGVADVIVHLLLHRQGEDLLRRLADAGDQRRVDAVAGDVEKAHLARRAADGVGHRLTPGEVIAGQIADIDGREFSKSVLHGGHGCGSCSVSVKNC